MRRVMKTFWPVWVPLVATAVLLRAGPASAPGSGSEFAVGFTHALKRKLQAHLEGPEVVEKAFRDEMASRLPSAEIADLRWENLQSNAMPLLVRCTIRVPGYAEQVGPRLIVKPGVFAAGAPPRFTASRRLHPIAFPHTWSEQDDVEIVIPEGYELEQATAPADVRAREELQTAAYSLSYVPARHTLIYARTYAFGRNGATIFEPESYEAIRFLFERVRVSDDHSIVLRPKEALAGAAASVKGAG